MPIYNSDDFDYWNEQKPFKPRIIPAEGDTMVTCSNCKGKGKIKMHNEETARIVKEKGIL